MERVRYSFQPGPAQLLPSIPLLLQEALVSGVLSRYHRDEVWIGLFAEAQAALKAYLDVPDDWLVAFCSGATEAWHIWIQATTDQTALHIVQGAFGERWFSLRASVSSFGRRYVWDFTLPLSEQIEELSWRYRGVGTIALVQVETSVGAFLPELQLWREAFPDTLIAVDATSSLGVLELSWEAVDFVFASVQKGLGLPAGMGVLLCSSRCVQLFRDYPAMHYNSLSRVIQMAQAHQPVSTPNVLGIYLLAKSLPGRPKVTQLAPRMMQRAERLYGAIMERGYEPFLPAAYRAPTVLTFRVDAPERLKKLFEVAERAGLYIGRGYGPYKETTFRVANFPALPDEAYEELLEVMAKV